MSVGSAAEATRSVTTIDGCRERLDFDLRSRAQVFGADEVVDVAAGSEPFWEWYASTVRGERPFRLRPVSEVPPYPPATRDCALWFSGGVESTYTLAQIGHLRPTLLSISGFRCFSGPHRKIGQIHFLCAAVAAALGFSVCYLGIERADLLLGASEFARGYIERSPLFAARWSEYQPAHRLQTVCGQLHKEEMITWLVRRGIRITGTCDRLSGGRWCGDCYKCFEAFYSAKAVGIDLGIPLTRRAFEDYHGEYRRFVDSHFVDNVNNAYQHYVRLQIVYHLRFDPESDCAA